MTFSFDARGCSHVAGQERAGGLVCTRTGTVERTFAHLYTQRALYISTNRVWHKTTVYTPDRVGLYEGKKNIYLCFFFFDKSSVARTQRHAPRATIASNRPTYLLFDRWMNKNSFGTSARRIKKKLRYSFFFISPIFSFYSSPRTDDLGIEGRRV